MRTARIRKLSLLSLSINLAYCLYTGVIGLTGHSWWFISLAAYYTVLSVMRFAVLLASRKGETDAGTEQFILRFTGSLLIALSVTLAGISYLSVLSDRGIQHHEIVMISIALYCFLKISFAIRNLLRIRKIHSPILKTLRNISFADGLVSIFSLQRSMLVSFPGMAPADIRLFNMLTGSAVYLSVFFLGIHLIIGGKSTMTKSKLVQANEKIAETVTDAYKGIEKAVVGGYKKIEEGVTEGYAKLEDKFIDHFLSHEGESLEEAKARLKKEQE